MNRARLQGGIIVLAAIAWVTAARAATNVATCPTTISSSGDYQLTADLACPGNGITITADAVHLMMGGHVLTGNGTGTGLDISGVTADVDVENGTFTGFSVGIRVANSGGVNFVGVKGTANATGMVLDHASKN